MSGASPLETATMAAAITIPMPPTICATMPPTIMIVVPCHQTVRRGFFSAHSAQRD